MDLDKYKNQDNKAFIKELKQLITKHFPEQTDPQFAIFITYKIDNDEAPDGSLSLALHWMKNIPSKVWEMLIVMTARGIIQDDKKPPKSPYEA